MCIHTSALEKAGQHVLGGRGVTIPPHATIFFFDLHATIGNNHETHDQKMTALRHVPIRLAAAVSTPLYSPLKAQPQNAPTTQNGSDCASVLGCARRRGSRSGSMHFSTTNGGVVVGNDDCWRGICTAPERGAKLPQAECMHAPERSAARRRPLRAPSHPRS